MKVIDTVNKSIASYPSLYLGDNYEDSKFAVLHQYFIVLGNGCEWAFTVDPKKAGYLTNHEYIRSGDEWIQKHNKPYGEEKFSLDVRFFKEKIYEILPIDKKFSEVVGYAYGSIGGRTDEANYKFETELSSVKNFVMEGEKVIPKSTEFVAMERKKEYSHKNKPYPNFQKQYSCFWEPGEILSIIILIFIGLSIII